METSTGIQQNVYSAGGSTAGASGRYSTTACFMSSDRANARSTARVVSFDNDGVSINVSLRDAVEAYNVYLVSAYEA